MIIFNTVTREATTGGDSELDLNLGRNHENKILSTLLSVGHPHHAVRYIFSIHVESGSKVCG